VYGLKVVSLPGKSPGEIALFWAESRVLLVGDALIAPSGKIKTVPDDKMDDPALLRRSLKRLMELDFDVLLVGDGDPILKGAKAAAAAFLG
jgi:glyoxylase-like metal-dependent hydrolase (beta-lactamase superfamily II)